MRSLVDVARWFRILTEDSSGGDSGGTARARMRVHCALPGTRRNASAAPIRHCPGGSLLMLGFVTIGTNDMERAAAFYDAVLGLIADGKPQALEQDLAEYLKEEQPVLAPPVRVRAFGDGVERLRDDVERAARRLELLERALAERS